MLLTGSGLATRLHVASSYRTHMCYHLLLLSTTGHETFTNTRATSRENHLLEYIDNPSEEGSTLPPSFDDNSPTNFSILNTGFVGEVESTEVEVH